MEEIGRITAVERQKKNNDRVSVSVDGAYLGSVEDIVWVRSGLKTGDVLTAQAWEDMLGRQEVQAALDRALKRLESRARSRAELERFLAEKGFSAEAATAALDKLQDYGYIDDGQYAAMFVRDRMALKPAGRRSMAGELKRLGIDEDAAEQALEQLSPEAELEAACAFAEKALKRTEREPDAKKRKAKVYAALARRGYSHDVIQAALGRLLSDPEE